jgi:tripartite-type tricarboxylate transporter receptor subunit TctC
MAAEEMPMKSRVLAALAATIFALTVPAKADDYPSRSMTMIIPFAAGGPTDVLAAWSPAA